MARKKKEENKKETINEEHEYKILPLIDMHETKSGDTWYLMRIVTRIKGDKVKLTFFGDFNGIKSVEDADVMMELKRIARKLDGYKYSGEIKSCKISEFDEGKIVIEN